MPTRPTQNSKRSGRYQPLPDYTPLYGVRLFCTESGYLMSFIALVLFSMARLYMSSIEQKNAGSFDTFALLGMVASVMLLGGGLLVLLGSHIKSLPGIFLFSGLALMMAADGIFCFSLAIETLSETDILGVLQCVLEVLFLLSLFVLLAVLLISCLNRRTAPSAGHFATVMSVFAVVLLLFRTLTTFASLSSALGMSFSWDQTTELNTEVNWVLRSVSADSDYAADMFYARLFERITLVLMFAAFLPPIFKFASFFRQYNMQMQISAELPGGHRNVREQRGNPYASGKFDLMSSLHNLREPDGAGETEDELSEDEADEQEESELGYCTPDYISGFDEPEEPVYAPLPEQKTEPQRDTETEAPPVVYNTANMLDVNYGKPVDTQDTADDDGDSPPAAAGNTGAQRVRVRPRSSIPSPDDESIWFRYSDD